MSILDWMDLYKRGYEADEPFALLLIEAGLVEDETVQRYRAFKDAYEHLLIEYQSTSAMNQSRATSARAGDTATTTAQVRT